jgi:hypothetical protein
LAFLVASGIAAHLVCKSRRTVPARYRIVYGVFAVAGLIVALEEISYGQKFFNWDSPGWFAQRNAKGETNLHNMFENKPSDILRALASIGCVVCCGLIPTWLHLRRIDPSRTAHACYLVPNLELVTLSGLTIVLTICNKIPSIRNMSTWSGHLGELKELCWSISAACYAIIISRRLTSNSIADERTKDVPSTIVASRRAA